MKEMKLPWQVIDLLAQTNDIYQLRLLEWAFVKAQGTLQHVDKNLKRINLQLVRDVAEIEIPLSFLTTDKAHASEHVKRAFELQNVNFLAAYEGRPIFIKAIAFPRIRRTPEGIFIRYYIHKSLWLALIDFSRGYRRLDIASLARLKRPLTCMIYFLIAKQTAPLIFNLDTFRNLLRLPDAYKKKSNLIARVLEPARGELTHTNTNFTYTFDTNTKGKTPQQITLTPTALAAERSEEIVKVADRLQIDITHEAAEYLEYKFAASQTDLKTIAPLLAHLTTPAAQVDELARIHTAALRAGARNPIAYLIATLQKKS